ncbi:MAG: hypothetical protein ACTSXP_14785, partial [Promethearchaeota archaeon]
RFFKKVRPFSVSVGYYYRIHYNTPLADLIMKDPSLWKNLSRPPDDDENFIKPIFFSQLSDDFIEELIRNDSIFNVAGKSNKVNYQLSSN